MEFEGEYIIRLRAAGVVPDRAAFIESVRPVLEKERDAEIARNPKSQRWQQDQAGAGEQQQEAAADLFEVGFQHFFKAEQHRDGADLVFFQHVTPGAFVAGLTLITGPADVVVALVKAMLFGLSAGLIACYKGISVGGGPAGVGNAVNETVVFTFIALFVINVLATAVGVQATA